MGIKWNLPEGGEPLVLGFVAPGMAADGCGLGGPDGKTLFLLEAKHLPSPGMLADPNTGQVRAVRVSVAAARDPTNPNYSAGYA